MANPPGFDEQMARLIADWMSLHSPAAQSDRKKNCPHPRYVNCGRITASGSRVYYRACAECGAMENPGRWLPADMVDPDEIESWEDRSTTNPPCQVCGRWGTELHHWAPKALFGAVVAEHWPTGWLCVGCHRLWHDTISRGPRPAGYADDDPEQPF